MLPRKMMTDMGLTPDALRSISALRGLTDEQLERLCALFQPAGRSEGELLFEPGDPPEALYLLAAGDLRLHQDHDEAFDLRAPTLIGELGAVTGLVPRTKRAQVGANAELWRVDGSVLRDFLAQNTDVALLIYANMLAAAADKASRDQIRLADMRHNIVRTQKAMKKMRDFLLESQDTVVSKPLHELIEGLIQQNRRVNYRVEPPPSLAARLRLDDKVEARVLQISRTHLRFRLEGGTLPESGARVSGVLHLSGPELPICGRVLRTIDNNVDLALDLLIDEYAALLEGYLTRVQMLDLLV